MLRKITINYFMQKRVLTKLFYKIGDFREINIDSETVRTLKIVIVLEY